MLEFVLAAPSIVSSSEPDALSNSLSQSLMTSVIGNTFKTPPALPVVFSCCCCCCLMVSVAVVVSSGDG